MRTKLGLKFLSTVTPKDKPFEVHDSELRGFILRVQPSGVMSYYFSYRRPDKRKFRTLIGKASQLTPQQARDKARDLSADVIKGIDPQLAKKMARAHSLGAFIKNDYQTWAECELRSGDEAVRRLSACFKSFLDLPLSEVTSWAVGKWRAERKKSGVKPSTINRDVAALRAALSKAVEWKIIERNPLADLKLMKVDLKGRTRFLSDGEETALIEALDAREVRIRKGRDSGNRWRVDRDYDLLPSLEPVAFVDHVKPMVILSMHTGLRRGEVFNLKWSDVEFGARPQIIVEGETSKNRQTGHIPLNKTAQAVLSAWHKQLGSPTSGYVFASKTGGRLSELKTAWTKILRDAGIANFRWHDLRHHFASRLVIKGVDLNTVRELLRHGDLQMTIRYAHLSPKVKASAVALLDICDSKIIVCQKALIR